MMPKKCYFLVLICLVYIRCANNNDDCPPDIDIPLGTIVADIDGVTRTFNVDANATLELIPWIWQQTALRLSISGKEVDTPNSESILVWFFAFPVREIDEGTYPDLNKQIYQYLEHKSLWRNDLYRYRANDGPDAYTSQSTIIRRDSVIQGVFSGNVIIGVGALGTEQPPLDHTITNGKFHLRLEYTF